MTKLNADTVASLGQPLYEVWNYIGSDVCEAAGPSISTAEVIECCIDADRLTTCVRNKEAGKAANDLVTLLIKEHGYTKVLKVLAKQFPMGY